MNPETALQQKIHIAVSREPDCVVWRNSVGVAEHWTPQGVQRVRYGLAPGSADLVGIVGGRFFALEIKTDTGRVAPEQDQWIDLVRRKGGFAAIVRSVDEARAAVIRARAGASE